MALSCSRIVLSVVAAAVLLCLSGSAEGGKPTCLDQSRKESPREKRIAENPSNVTLTAHKTLNVTCYHGDSCCVFCLYDSSEAVKGFDLFLEKQNTETRIFGCDANNGPDVDPHTHNYTFEEQQQKFCMAKGFNVESGKYICKMKYASLDLQDSVTSNEVTVTDKLGTPTVHLENKGPVKEGRDKVNFTCSLDTKFEPALISVTWYNGTNILNPEVQSKSIDGNRLTFWTAYTVTRFDNRQEVYCTVTDGNQTKTSTNVTLDVQYKPRVDCTIPAQLVIGRAAEVICDIDANPGVLSIVFPKELREIGWVQNGSNISTTHLRPPCNKTFSVTATNEWGSGEGDFVMDCWSETIITHYESDNSFMCKTEGNPVAEISWAMLYGNDIMWSYNSTASTVNLDVKMLVREGVTAIICRADQRQPLYFQPRFHVFNLAGELSSFDGKSFGIGIAVAFLVVALCLLLYKCHIWKRLKRKCTKFRLLPAWTKQQAVPQGGDTGLRTPPKLQAPNGDKQVKFSKLASDDLMVRW
ncbi:uncharacterized protein LOC144887556 [Branchiostoma floridae x Branchiostoma japonicum]